MRPFKGLRLRRRTIPVMALLVPLMALAMLLLLSVDQHFHQQLLRQQLQAEQQRLLLGQAQWLEQRLRLDPDQAANNSKLWQLGESGVLTTVVDRRLQPLAAASQRHAAWQRFQPEMAQRALASAQPLSQFLSADGLLQLYYPMKHLIPEFSGRLLFLEMDLTAANHRINQQLLHSNWRQWLLASVIFLLFSWLSYRLLVVPFRQLHQGIERFGQTPSQPLRLGPLTEFRQLWRRFHNSHHRLRRAYLQLAETERRWVFAIEGLQAGIWDWHIDHDRVYLSHHWKSMLGYRDDELVSSFDAFEQRIHPEDRHRVLALIQHHMQQQQGLMETSLRLLHRNGHYIWVQTRGLVVEWDNKGRAQRMVGSHIDISEQVNRQQGSQFQSRQQLLHALTPLLQREDGDAGALFCLQLQSLPLLALQYGEDGVEQLFKQLLMRLQRGLPLLQYSGAYGEGRLALLLPLQCHFIEQWQQQLQTLLQQPFTIDGQGVVLRCHIGVASYLPEPELEIARLLNSAELALAQAGQANAELQRYHPQLQQQLLELQQQQQALHNGLTDAKLRLRYSAVTNVAGDSDIALVDIAMDTPLLAQWQTDKLLVLADGCGELAALTELQLSRSCRELTVLRRYGVQQLLLSLSAAQWQWPDLPQRVAFHLNQHGLAGSALIMALPAATIDRQIQQQLTELGVELLLPLDVTIVAAAEPTPVSWLRLSADQLLGDMAPLQRPLWTQLANRWLISDAPADMHQRLAELGADRFVSSAPSLSLEVLLQQRRLSPQTS